MRSKKEGEGVLEEARHRETAKEKRKKESNSERVRRGRHVIKSGREEL